MKRNRAALLAAVLLCALFCASFGRADTVRIRVAYNTNAAPFTFTDANGAPAGLFKELMDRIGAEREIGIEYCAYSGYSECYEALRRGDVRVVLGAVPSGANISFSATSTILSSSLCLVVPAESKDRYADGRFPAEASVTYEYGTASSGAMFTMHAKMFIPKSNQASLLNALIGGEADAALMTEDCCGYFLKERKLTGEYSVVRRNIGTVNYVLLLRSNDYSLRQQLDSAIVKVHTSGAYEETVRKWFDEGSDDSAWLRHLLWITGSLAAVAGLAFLSAFFLNRLLKKRVAEKTEALENANLELDEKMRELLNENRLRKEMIERSRNGMLIIDKEDRVTLINKAAARMSGDTYLTFGNAVGVDIRLLPFWSEIFDSLRHGAEPAGPETDAQTPQIVTMERGGETRKYRCYVTEGSAINKGARLVAAEDITAEEKEKRALFEKEKNTYLNRLIAGIAHEIRNPLASIKTSAYLMREDPEDEEVKKAFAAYVPGEVDRISSLVEGLIQYARPYKGSPERFDASALLEECRYPAKIEAKKYPIEIVTDTAPGLFIYADRDRIKQSIINIILNGLESMERKIEKQGGKLTLRLTSGSEGDEVFLRIRDEGEGMTVAEQEKCSEPFFTTKQTGTGLGLPIVYQYMMENGGRVTIDSLKDEYTEITLIFRKAGEDEKQDPDRG